MELGAYSQCVLPGFGQQDGVLVWRGGFWEVVQDGEPVLEQLRPVVGEQKVQSLDVALLEGGGHMPNPDGKLSTLAGYFIVTKEIKSNFNWINWHNWPN